MTAVSRQTCCSSGGARPTQQPPPPPPSTPLPLRLSPPPSPQPLTPPPQPPRWPPAEPVFLSWDPRIILVKRFLSLNESAHIIGLAKESMSRSSVVGQDGGSVIDNIRTSSGTFLAPFQDEVVERIQFRVAELTMLPAENQESLQVLHYGLNEKYGAHMDTFFDARHITPERGNSFPQRRGHQ
jgi:prolyl 4-hydroxylase